MQNKHTFLEHLPVLVAGLTNLHYPSVWYNKQECWVTPVAWCDCCSSSRGWRPLTHRHTHTHTALYKITTYTTTYVMFKWQADNASKHGLSDAFECFVTVQREIPWHHRAAKQFHLEVKVLVKSSNLVFTTGTGKRNISRLCTAELEKLSAPSRIISAWMEIISRPSHLTGEVSEKAA